MRIKKRMALTGTLLALGGVLPFAAPTLAEASADVPEYSQYTPETWTARSVEEVKQDLTASGNTQHYLLIWGDTLSVISEATGIPIQTLVDLNQIADRDFILAGDTLYLSGDSVPGMTDLTWSSMQEAIDFYEANIIANNEPDVAEVALGSEFYRPETWELISNDGDTIVLSINNEGVGGKDIVEFVKGKDYTVMTFFAADSPYPDRPTARQTVRNSDKITVKREELNPVVDSSGE